VQVAPSTSAREATPEEPPTPYVNDDDDEEEYTQTQETVQDAPSSPTPTVIVSHEIVEYETDNAPASPNPSRFKVETDIEVEAEVEASLDVYVDDVAQNSSLFQAQPERKSPSPDIDAAASAYSGFQSRDLSPINEETTSEIAHFFSPPTHAVQHVMSSTEKDIVNMTEEDGRNISYINYYHQIFTHLRQLLANDPPRVEEALQIVDEQRDLHEPQPITSSPPNAAIQQASPTSSVFHTPSEPEKPASGGFLSALVSPFRRIATPVSRISRLLGRGSQTQSVQKTSAAPATTKAQASTPVYTRSHAPSPDTPSGAMSPYLAGYLSRPKPQDSPSHNDTSHNKRSRSSDNYDITDFAPVTPSQQRFTTSTAGDGHSANASTLYLPDGRPIPKEFRNWIGHTRARQQRDMELVQRRDLEVASGDRVLTKEEQGFKAQTEFRQLCLEQWRARQPGNRLRAEQERAEQADAQMPQQQQQTTPMAGRKRGNAEIRETTEVDENTTPRKMQRKNASPKTSPNTTRKRVLTPVGVTAPVPGHPEYRHVNEERPFSPSPEPLRFSRGGSFTVPDDSDDDEEMTETAPTTAPAVFVPVNPPNAIGIPDNFYDSSSDEEDTDMESSPTAAPTSAPAADAIPPFGQSANGAPPATPYAHKYTPHKPSGLRAVETMASSPIPMPTNALGNVITPPHSPDVPAEFGEILEQYLEQHPATAVKLGFGVDFEVDGLVRRVVGEYKGLFERRNGVVA
jgi:hypothetical protein